MSDRMSREERSLKEMRRERIERDLDRQGLGLFERMTLLGELNRLDRELAS